MSKIINQALREAIARVKLPIETASGMPSEVYRDPEFFQFERDHVLGGSWAAIAFASDIPQGGYVKPIEFMGLPLVIVRDKLNNIDVFHNVCSHRGMELVAQEGPAKTVIQCRYHSWCYSLSGELKATPHIGGVGLHEAEGFSRQGKNLKPVRCHVWLDMIFINLSQDAPLFEKFIAPLTQRWQKFVQQSDFQDIQPDQHSTLQLEVNCNWKLAIENYCEAYHLPWVHPGLNSYSPLTEHYNLVVSKDASGQGSNKYTLSEVAGTTLPKFKHWPKDKHANAEYVSLYPNVLLGIQVDHVFAIILTPLAQNHTHESLKLMFVTDDALKDTYSHCRQSVLEAWREVFTEDIFAIESMQKGRNSPAFQGGAFSPVHDGPSHHFHNWVADQYLAAG